MVFLGYVITLVVERSIGLYVLNKIYPELRRNTMPIKCALLVTYISVVLLHIVNGYDSYISNLYAFAAGLEIATLYCIFFRARYSGVLLWEMMYQINLALLKLPALIIFGIAEQKGLEQLNRNEISVGELAWSILVDIILLVLVRKSDGWLKLIKSTAVQGRRRLWILAGIQWCLLTYNMWLGLRGFQTVDLALNIVFIVCATLAVQCFSLYIVYQNSRTKSAMLDTAQNMIQNHNLALEEMYNRNNRKLHDVKHHMLSIAGYLEKQDVNKAKACIEEYLRDIGETGQQAWTGFQFLDFIINYKKMEMDNAGIAFVGDFALYECPMDDAEMGVVLGNLLDNAIEAARMCEAENRKIYMCMENRNQMLVLNMKNSMIIQPKQENGRFISSKADKMAHGLGVKSVRRIVEKYGGEITFQYDSEQFEVTILI